MVAWEVMLLEMQVVQSEMMEIVVEKVIALLLEELLIMKEVVLEEQEL